MIPNLKRVAKMLQSTIIEEKRLSFKEEANKRTKLSREQKETSDINETK